MVHYYCPFCWTEIAKDDKTCPRCGGDTGEWDEKSFAEKLVQALNHSVHSTVYRSCYILGERRERSAVKPLIDLLKRTGDHYLMAEIIEALGKIGDVNAVPSLFEMLNNRSFIVRKKAAAVLGDLGYNFVITKELERESYDHGNDTGKSTTDSINKCSAVLEGDSDV